MLVIDTNVVSEIIGSRPLPAILAWFARQSSDEVFICAVTEAELRYGVALLSEGRRRSVLAADVDRMLTTVFAGRILPFDSPAAIEFADVAARRQLSGRPISVSDAQIAAIARSRGASVATRNVRDFEGCGIEVIDPWA